MNVQEVKDALSKIPQLKKFVWSDNDNSNVFGKLASSSAYATMLVPTRTFKSVDGNEYRLGGFYSIFIAHMYAGEIGKEFFYITIDRGAERRYFRKRDFHKIEWNKGFFSGKTVKEVVNAFNKEIEDYIFS